MTLTPEACRAGRGILKWSMRDLADRAGVAWTTIARLENGDVTARGSTAKKIEDAFEAGGVELVTDETKTGAVLVYARRRGPRRG